MLGGVERACLVLRFKWGLEEIEIGECFGFTESRASQLLSKAIDTVAMIVSDGRVEKKIGAEESRKCDREGCSNMAEAGQTYCSFECAVKKRGEP